MHTTAFFAPLSGAAATGARASRIALHRGVAVRWLAVLAELPSHLRRGRAEARAERQRRAAHRALAQLDGRLLRDLGLADHIPPRSGGWSELDRAPW